MKALPYKPEKPHVAKCGAVASVERGDWGSPWWLPTEPAVYLDALGRKRGGWHGRRWLRFRCNDSACDASVLVREDDVLRLLPLGKVSR